MDQYARPNADRWNDPKTTPENLLLWFHRLPWDYRLKSGQTLWQGLVAHYHRGAEQAAQMEKAWAALRGSVDGERHAAVAARLRQQALDAAAWRDKCLNYFGQFAKRPTTPATGQGTGPADVPAARTDQNSVTAHAQLVEKARRGRIDVYFAGDSITRRWGATDYPDLLVHWRQQFFGWNAANFGWGGDTTQNMLWRLGNGELDDVHPKVIVILAGTNNIGIVTDPVDVAERAEDVSRGIKAILDVMRRKAPKATIILTAIFPRNDSVAVMPVIDETNRRIARFADGRSIRYLNINDALADAGGKLFDGMTGDRLHPTIKGYQVWADALKPILTELLGPPASEDYAPPPTGDPAASAARTQQPPSSQRVPATTSASFGMVDDKPVQLYTLTNRNGLVARITNYGAIVTELLVPDRSGRLADVVLGFEGLDGYAKGHPYFGAIVGRVANRVGNAEFTLDGRRYPLAANDKPHHLHGGRKGWDKVVWSARAVDTPEGPALDLTYVSPDGEEGYPGTVTARTVYTLTNDNELKVEMQATTDKTTLVNMAHHSYWNLGGHDSGTVLDHELTLYADRYTPGTPMVPDGRVMPVTGTPFDFTSAKPIGRELKQTGLTPVGYDHNFVVNGEPNRLRPVARLEDPKSGRVMTLSADRPGVQFYTGNFLDGSTKGKGAAYVQHAGLCLETQAFPNAINVPAWQDQVILRPGQTYRHVMVHTFDVEP